MMVGNLHIEIAENGFIVYEQNKDHAMIGKQWAFESAKTLADFIHDWGQGNTKVDTKPENENKSN